MLEEDIEPLRQSADYLDPADLLNPVNWGAERGMRSAKVTRPRRKFYSRNDNTDSVDSTGGDIEQPLETAEEEGGVNEAEGQSLYRRIHKEMAENAALQKQAHDKNIENLFKYIEEQEELEVAKFSNINANDAGEVKGSTGELADDENADHGHDDTGTCEDKGAAATGELANDENADHEN